MGAKVIHVEESYVRRCPKCRRKMTATRGPAVIDGHAIANAVLAWSCSCGERIDGEGK